MNLWDNMTNRRFGSRIIGIILAGVMLSSLVLSVLANSDTEGANLENIVSKVDTENIQATSQGLSDFEVHQLREALRQIDSGDVDAGSIDVDEQTMRDIVLAADTSLPESTVIGTAGEAELPEEAVSGETVTDQPPTEQPETEAPATEVPNAEVPVEGGEVPITDEAGTPAENVAPPEVVEPERTITAPEELAEPVVPVADVDDDPILDYPDGIVLVGSDNEITLTEAQIQEILSTLPAGLSTERVGAVLNAYSLVNKISYFWGGKSYLQGWDPRWGNSAHVTSGGSSSSGTYRPYGLDCSGYVAWVFCNTAGYSVAGDLGISTRYQWGLSQETAWEDAQPGDLAFFYNPELSGSINHVGVVVGWDLDGELLVAHCSSSKNTVAVTRAAATGFKYIRTPDIYASEDFVADSYSHKGLGTYLLWQNTAELEIDDIEQLYIDALEAGELEIGEAVLTVDDLQIGDLIFSESPIWGTESTVGIVTGFDKENNVLISYPIDAPEVAEAKNAEDEANISEETDEDVKREYSVIAVSIEQLAMDSVRRIDSAAALSYLKGELPIYKMKAIFGGKELAEKAKSPYEMETPEAEVEID